MANKIITDYTAAGAIDASSDEFLLWQNSTNSYKKINRNTIMGVSGQPADLSTAQTFTNKVLDNSNTITLKDTLFTLQDDSDTTKQAKFQLSGITTATTRTYTLPNASSTLADLSTTQTFTNKTLTSPVITGGSIANSAITVDSISEYTSGNGVTVAGLNIKSGKLNSNNSVVTANITDTAVTPAKLQSGTGSGWSWQSFSPTWTNLTVGNGTVNYSKYIQTGKTVNLKYSLTLGSTSVIGTSPTFTLPVTASTDSSAGGIQWGTVTYIDVSAGSTFYTGAVVYASTTTGTIFVSNASATYSTLSSFTATIPVAYATGDTLVITATYEAA